MHKLMFNFCLFLIDLPAINFSFSGCVVPSQQKENLMISILDFPLIEKLTSTYLMKSEFFIKSECKLKHFLLLAS